MAVAVTLLTADGVDAPGTNSQSTASISPTANATILVGVSSRLALNDANEIADPSGGGLSWTSVYGVNHDAAGTGSYLELWRTETGGSPGSFTISLDSTDTPSGVIWQVYEVTGTDLTTANGVEQYAEDDAASGITATTVFSVAPASTSAVLQFNSIQSSVEKTFAVETSFTKGSETSVIDNEQTAVQYITSSSPTSIDADWQAGTSAGIAAIAVEVNEGGVDDTATLTAVAASVGIPTAATIVDSAATLTVVAVSVGVPAVAASGTTGTAILSAVAVTVGVPAVTPQGEIGATATPTAVPLTVGVPTVSLTVDTAATLTAVGGTVGVPAVAAAGVTVLSHFYNPAVTLQIDVAFADNPLVYTPTWVDITGDVRSFTVTRGRTSELDEYKAGVATILVDANAGDYDPTNTGGAHYPDVVPMKQVRIRAAYDGTTYPLFRGNVTGWPMSVKGQTDETVSIKAVEGFKILALQKDSTTQVEELSGVRVGNLLDEAGWPASLRTIGTGVATIPAGTPECQTVLAQIRQVKDSEAGQFYIAADGRATFRNRTYRAGLSSQATFGPATGQVPYQDIKTDYDDSQIWNRIEIMIGGFPSYSSSTASQDSYGIRTLTVNEILLPNTTDGDDLADVYRDRYKDPLERIESITLKPEASPALLWPQVLGRDLSDKVTVEYVTNNGDTKSLPSYIEGISHRVQIGRLWQTTFALTQFE